ncbi:hypothetical protein EBR96_07955 [bacterium]|nr:hypothetical protein [bacterium]
MPIVTRDDYRNVVTAIIEVVEKGKPLGVYLVSNGLGAPQGVEIDGVTYQLQIRPVRHYFPYYIQLIEFVQEYYPDTNVPKNYASKVRVIDPHQSAPRDVTIYMNNPLRYDGNAHYQASFGEDGKSTVLQVVSNPGWQVPYVACVMISIGLIWHFGLSLSRFLKRRTQS